jgi:hypothetical protein
MHWKEGDGGGAMDEVTEEEAVDWELSFGRV